MSVVSVPSAAAATMTSPSLREAIEAALPSALVTVAVEGKHGSCVPPGGGGGVFLVPVLAEDAPVELL